jgi:hypothetical protein
MFFELKTRPEHTGYEQYVVSFSFGEQDDLFDVKALGVQFEIRPETVTLIWERLRPTSEGYGQWRRVTKSHISGHRVLKNGWTSDKVTGVVEVFTSSAPGSPLTKYASGLPHLEQMIEDLEKNLPA